MGELTDKLTEYIHKDIYPFHMPGHKRKVECNVNPYLYDITEITGFDDLGNPQDILKRLENRIANAYGSDEAFLLINGSTSGVMSGISAVLNPKDTLLMARNSHKSAYNSVFLRQIKTEYIFPKTDAKLGINLDILPEDVEKKLSKNKNIKAVYITSPTYEGIISNIGLISDIVHRYGAVLIVDAAHGAHLGHGTGFLKNPAELGADITIMSLHKTLPAPTQTAVICVKGNRINVGRLRKFINIYNSSSPSYLLMCGVERCLDIVENNEKIFSHYFEMLSDFRTKCKGLKNLFLYEPECMSDIGKIVIGTCNCNLTGDALKAILLDKYGLELEMSLGNYVLAMTSVMDSQEGFDRLYNALLDIDAGLIYSKEKNFMIPEKTVLPQAFFQAYEADVLPKKTYPLKDTAGKISGDYIYAYPPGIPWIVPGEIISEEILKMIEAYIRHGYDIRGIENSRIQIVER